MKIIVLKFGGTSVGSVERIMKVASIITSYIKKKFKVFIIDNYFSGKIKNITKNITNSLTILLDKKLELFSSTVNNK